MTWVFLDLFKLIMFVTWKNCVFSILLNILTQTDTHTLTHTTPHHHYHHYQKHRLMVGRRNLKIRSVIFLALPGKRDT